MTKRKLPAAAVGARPGLRSEVPLKALDHWNPDVRMSEEADNTISVLDVIGEDFWGDGITARRVAAALRRIGAERDVVVNVNSPGGDFFEGLAIYNTLREHKGSVMVNILGLAASAASVIAMAGDEVRIARAGFVMIHNTWVVAMGDRHALAEASAWLSPFDQVAVDIYAARTGQEPAELAKMLDAETWIAGSAAVDMGFADDFLASDQVAASASARAETVAMLSERKLDAILARAGIARSERRRMLGELKGGTQDAARHGTQDAAVLERGVEDLLSEIRSLGA